jgi:Holliday junction resolvase RusA-like endonuclease
MKVTRSGHHYAGARFKSWRACAVETIRNQLPKNFQMFTKPVDIRIDYFAEDRRRRDQPGIMDALWHVLEKAGDALLWAKESSRSYDKSSPRVVITFL